MRSPASSVLVSDIAGNAFVELSILELQLPEEG